MCNPKLGVMVNASKPGHRALRKGRVSLTGHYYFLSSATAERNPIFQRHQEAANIVLETVQFISARNQFRTDAVVIMPDHIHFAGCLLENSISAVMNQLKSYTANRILEITGLPGPIWQRGFHDHLLRNNEDYRLRLRYLLENPVRAGLVDDYRHYPYFWSRFQS